MLQVSTNSVTIIKCMMQLLAKTDAELNLCSRLRDVIPPCFSGHFKAIYAQQSGMLEAKARSKNRGFKRPSYSSVLQHVVDGPDVTESTSGPSTAQRGGTTDRSGYLCVICCEVAKTPVAAKLCGHVLCSQVNNLVHCFFRLVHSTFSRAIEM